MKNKCSYEAARTGTTDTSRHSVQECHVQGHFGGVILRSSTSNVSVELGGITGGNPREP